MNFTEKENYNFNDLVEIVKILRAPDGCPWDREQTVSYTHLTLPTKLEV